MFAQCRRGVSVGPTRGRRGVGAGALDHKAQRGGHLLICAVFLLQTIRYSVVPGSDMP